jgi:xylulokinase
MAYLLGIDVGTSGTKTVIFDEKGNTVASAAREYPLYQPQTGWAEQEPEDWWKAARESIADAVRKSGVDPKDVRGLGLSGQMHGMVLLDKDDKVLRPAIIWCDQRTQPECDEITEKVGAKRLVEITCNPALTGFTAGKVVWVKNHQPEIFEKTRRVLLPKDYIRFMLTGEYATEVSDASGMQFLDVPKRAWSKELMDTLGIPFEWLPKVYESFEISGKLTKRAAELTGLWEGMPVAGGGGDQAAGAVGNGIVRKGVVSSTIGTSGVVFAHMDGVVTDPLGRLQTFCHAVPGAWHVMGVTQAAGLSLQWFRNEFCAMEKAVAERVGTDVYEIMAMEAQQANPGCGGLIYLPYLMGERAPHLDPLARGAFFGLTARHRRQEMIRSVMEGVSYSLLDCISIIRGLGVTASEVRASGGGGRSQLWRQMQADMFETDVVTINSSEGGALGAALIAGVGAGVYKTVPEACDAVIKVAGRQKPDRKNTAIYKKYYEIYKNLYKALKASYRDVAGISD